ncbi:MAG: amidohydrolase [Deltaproteobacteria bacterium]|nr:amidohydrolase [Deltaproteobacteria bacterium]MBW2723346.1 amidohydrolase [Deltaproteobacteria bacterium]
MDRYLVISSDCHAGLPPERYREYVDPQYREAFDAALPIQNAAMQEASERFLIADINAEWRAGHESGLEGAWDHAERIKVLDGDGCAAEIIYQDGITEMNTPPFGAGLGMPTEGITAELQWAGARAHNRWISEFCSITPDRHAGLAIIPMLWDVELAVKEIRWAHSNGLRGILIPTQWGKLDSYAHPKYDPVWRICEELGMVLNIHSGAAPMADYGTGQGMVGAYISEVGFFAARPITLLIWNGVFERFPGLRLMVSEATAIWVPEYLQLLDFRYEITPYSAKLGDYTSHLKRKPSEYFHDCVYMGASCMPRREAELRHEIGVENLLWGSDYPHPEGTWPETRKQMVDTFHDIPEDEIALMLGGNAAKLFGFDVDKLNKIADEIGPLKSDFVTASS